MEEMIFIADLIACSTYFGHHCAHHQELESIIQVVLPVVFGALVFKLSVWCGAEGCVFALRVRKANTQPSAPHHTDNLKTKAPNTTGSTTCVILSSS